MEQLEKLEQLKDIKDIQNLSIDFLPYFIGIGLFLFIILLTFLIYFYFKYAKAKPTKAQKAKKYLKNMDYNRDARDIAYDFTLYGYDCLNSKFKDEYESIVIKLELFKYKKDLPSMNEELIDDMKEYIKVRL